MTDTLYGIWGSTLAGIADAIRTKNPDVTGLVDPADMKQDILDISGGGGEPYIPMKQLISEFDFKSSTPFYDKVKCTNLSTNMRAFRYTAGVGVTVTSRNSRIRCGTNFDYAGMYEVVVKFGAFDKTVNPPTSYPQSFLLRVSQGTGYLMLNYVYNSKTSTGKWWIHDQTGNNIYLNVGENEPYYFENKTLTMTYGCKYVDGVLVRDQNKGYFYVNDVQLHQNGASIVGDAQNQIQVVFIGDGSSSTFLGATYESLKIWEYRYDLDDTDDIIQPITITANGTYTANGNTVAGYSPITVNVHEVLESEFDLLHCNSTVGYHDLVKNVYLPTNRYRNFANGYLTANGGAVSFGWCNYGDVKRYVVQMGTFDRSLEPQQQYLGLFSFVYDTSGCVFYYDNDNSRWLVRDSGGTEYISDSEIPKYAVDGATIEVVLGARYIDGELYRGKKVNGVVTESYHDRLTMYIHATNNQTYEVEYTAHIGADYADYMATWRVGSGGSVWLGALFENVKIYNVLDCYEKYYEAPVSLMSASSSEEPETE